MIPILPDPAQIMWELLELKDRDEYLKSLEIMFPVKSSKTGLSVNIWLDEVELYKKIGMKKKIRFQLNKEKQFDLQQSCPMFLTGEIPFKMFEELGKIIDVEVSAEDIEAVKNFVKNNSYALSFVAGQKLELDDFWKIFIKGGEPATTEAITELKKKCDELRQPDEKPDSEHDNVLKSNPIEDDYIVRRNGEVQFIVKVLENSTTSKNELPHVYLYPADESQAYKIFLTEEIPATVADLRYDKQALPNDKPPTMLKELFVEWVNVPYGYNWEKMQTEYYFDEMLDDNSDTSNLFVFPKIADLEK